MNSCEEDNEILALMKGSSLKQPSHWHFLCASATWNICHVRYCHWLANGTYKNTV